MVLPSMTYRQFGESAVAVSLQQHLDQFHGSGIRLHKILNLQTTIRDDVRISAEGIDTSTRFDFQPKAVFFTEDASGQKKFGILEYSSTSLALKDVGVMQAYARLSNPDYAVVLCKKSISKELAYLLANPVTGESLLRFHPEKSIALIDVA
jgi:hypothetical protein